MWNTIQMRNSDSESEFGIWLWKSNLESGFRIQMWNPDSESGFRIRPGGLPTGGQGPSYTRGGYKPQGGSRPREGQRTEPPKSYSYGINQKEKTLSSIFPHNIFLFLYCIISCYRTTGRVAAAAPRVLCIDFVSFVFFEQRHLFLFSKASDAASVIKER